MAQIGNEMVDRPPPGQPIDEQAAKQSELQEEVKHLRNALSLWSDGFDKRKEKFCFDCTRFYYLQFDDDLEFDDVSSSQR